jgi:hypothetical protein
LYACRLSLRPRRGCPRPSIAFGRRTPPPARAAHKSKREIEELVAVLAPRPDVAALIRKMPERQATAPPHTASLLGVPGDTSELGPDRVASAPLPAVPRSATMEPLAPSRYKVQFTASAALCEKLDRLKALMRAGKEPSD